jgi:zinc protease
MFAADDAELDLAADLIAHGKTSRLYKLLVYEKQIVTDVVAYQHSRELSGVFQIATTATPGVSLDDVHTLVIDTLRELASTGPTAAELERARAQTDAQFIYRLQTIGGFGGKSDQLNAYNVFRGDPSYFAADRARYERATPDSIVAALRRWIVERPYVTLSVVAKGSSHVAVANSSEVRVS